MDEAIDQEGAIIYPAFHGDDRAQILLANEKLHHKTDGHAVASIPSVQLRRKIRTPGAYAAGAPTHTQHFRVR